MEQHELITLYRNAFPKVARFIRSKGGDLDKAKDIFHDALVAFLEKEAKGQMVIHTSAEAYITGIARILWLKRVKAAQIHGSLEEGDAFLSEASLETTAKQSTITDYLQLAGSRCMDLLIAFYYQTVPLQDIVRNFKFSSRHSASVQKYKCLEKLREQLKQKELYEEIIG